MENVIDTSLKTLNAFANLNESLLSLAASLRTRPTPGVVRHGFGVRRLDDGCIIEAYVEREPNENASFCLWFEVTIAPGRWKIHTAILKDQSGGQEVVAEFPDQNGKFVDDLLDGIKSAGDQLIASAQSFEFSK